MTDPSNHVAQITAPPAVAIGATLAGVMLWPYMLALVAGAVALIYMGRMEPLDSLKSVIGSSFIGGSLSQLIVVILVVQDMYPSVQLVARDAQLPLVALIAIVLGLACQKAMPALLKRLEKQIGGKPDDRSS
jgi:tetrahydromethanopterin S-methyltransferase subunit F